MINRYNVEIIDSDERGNYFGLIDTNTGDVIASDSWMPELADLCKRLNLEVTEEFTIYTKRILEYCVCNGDVENCRSADFLNYIRLMNKHNVV